MIDIKSVLFDLDGTLLDTAPDLAHSLNQLRIKHKLSPLPLNVIRPHAGYGSKAMLKVGFDVDEDHPQYTALFEEFLSLYQTHLADHTTLFPNMDKVLNHLDAHHIPWGIVTNKPSRFTFDLLKAMNLSDRAAAIVCGDTLTTRKPDPAPILHACDLINQDPAHCLYIGDTITDVIASKAAGTKSLVTLYGYIGPDDNPLSWNADAYVQSAEEIIPFIQP